jgi:hypothetical protein
MNIRTLSLFLLTMAFSCIKKEKEKQVVVPSKKTIHVVRKKIDTLHITDRYIDKILNYNLSLAAISFFERRDSTIRSDYDPATIDTVITLSNPKDRFVYYASGNRSAPGRALMRFDIRSNAIHLPDSIYSGMDKYELLRKFNTKPFKGVLLVTEEEGYQQLYFTFEKDKVASITFESTYLD